MSDPLSTKLRVIAYTSLSLLLALGLASGFRWATGSDTASVTAATGSSFATATRTVPRTGVVEPNAADIETLAAVSRAFTSIANSVTPAVVYVDTRGAPHARLRLRPDQRIPEPFEEFFRRFPQREETPFDVPLGRGSGFIVSEDGYILTNNHVVAAAEKIAVELVDGRQLPAELVGRDPTTDVAVLKVEARDLPTIPMGNSEQVAVGEFVLAIGNPGTEFGSSLPFTVTSGIVSAKGRDLGIIRRAAAGSNYAIEDLIQTDAVINPGNSGGPLVNHRGEVIGINTAIASLTGFYQGYGFAIPINLARSVMEDLIEHGRVRRGALGVSITAVTRADARKYGLDSPKGALVQDFSDDSPARQAGLRREDVIVEVEGRPVERVGQLQRIIASYNPGTKVNVTVVRNGERQTFEVELTEASVPAPERVAARDSGPRHEAILGIEVQNISTELAQRFGLPEDAEVRGALITDVARFGPAWNAGLRQGLVIQEVNDRAVTNAAEFEAALSDVSPGDIVSLDAVDIQDGETFQRVFNIEIPAE